MRPWAIWCPLKGGNITTLCNVNCINYDIVWGYGIVLKTRAALLFVAVQIHVALNLPLSLLYHTVHGVIQHVCLLV